MRHVITNAESSRQRLGLLTDSARNVRFYIRLGFATLLEGSEKDPLRLWAMTRQIPAPVPTQSAP